MSTTALLAVLCLACVAAMLVIARNGWRRAEWVVKPLASTCFVAAALTAGALDSRFGTILVIGLALAWWGDVLLIPASKTAFLAGLVAFLLGHLGYAIAFAVRGIDPVATAGACVVVGALAIPVGRWLLPSVEPAMKVPVLAYMTVISAMVALAIGTVRAHGNPWVAVGAIAFYASDLAVAREKFVAPGWRNRLWGLPLYYGAQLVLAWCAGRA